MTPVFRLISFGIFCAAIASFWFAPGWLEFDVTGVMWWTATAQLGGPLLASVCCLLAARRSHDTDRSAWLLFAVGAGLYFIGNLGYAVGAIAGAMPTFPSLIEGAYFVMAGFFATGMLRYSQMRHRFGTIQIYNFALIYCAVALSSLFLLNRSISSSMLSQLGTIAAFFYPVLWFSVAAFGLVSLALYGQRRNAFAFALLVGAMLAEAFADFRYALALMDGTYVLGGLTQLLWVASAALIVWAALERIVAPHIVLAKDEPAERKNRSVAQAAVPAIAVGAIILSGSLSRVISGNAFAWLGAVLAIAFALVAGFREYWIIRVQRQLRRTVEIGRSELVASERRLTAVLESTTDSVLVVDRDWRIVYFNRHAAATINQRDRLRVGISIWELLPAAQASGEADHYRKAVATAQPETFEIFVEDRQIWLGIQAYPTEDGLSLFFHDISLQKQARDEVEHLALHDSLTGLANRLLFQRRLDEVVATGKGVAVLLLDLDHFKDVNDTLGHPVGDALLMGTAARLRACLGQETTIGRLGGDEFAAVLTGYEGRHEIGVLAQRVLDATIASQMIDGQSIRVGASIGIALSAGLGEAPDQLFRNADIALYAAKTDSRAASSSSRPRCRSSCGRSRRCAPTSPGRSTAASSAWRSSRCSI
ncbi:MAG: diguanylate cyclase [Devosia sp.]